jgi:uncharacterized protein YbjQ (UPF0145 family)
MAWPVDVRTVEDGVRASRQTSDAKTIAKGVHVILTTGPAVDGRPVERYLDVVSAQAIMGVHIGKDITAGLRNIVGGRSKSYEGEVAKAVAQVMDELKAGGDRLGADAILSIDIDYETVGDNMLMVAVSGTAVKLG